MLIEFISRSDAKAEKYDYRQAQEVHVNGKCFMRFYDGEPEDANLARDFSDVYKIHDLIALVIKAHREDIIIKHTDSDEL